MKIEDLKGSHYSSKENVMTQAESSAHVISQDNAIGQ